MRVLVAALLGLLALGAVAQAPPSLCAVRTSSHSPNWLTLWLAHLVQNMTARPSITLPELGGHYGVDGEW